MLYLTKALDEGNVKLKNRLVMPPMATGKALSDGEVSEELLRYYDDKSQGGYISLIIIEHSYISQGGKVSPHQLSVAQDNKIEGLKRLARVIQKNGSKVAMQINHVGSLARGETAGGVAVGPSAVVNPRGGSMIPKELTQDEIVEIVNAFQEAAKRVKDAGFDAVEIHCAHGYLLNQFFSPLTNKRTDTYGGDVYGRIRIHLEVIQQVRKAVGAGYPILLRLGADDYTEGGTTIKDSIIAAQEFEKAGVDLLDITGGMCGYIVPGLSGQGYFAPLSEKIKEAVSLPVILTGGVTKADAAEKLLSEQKADLIGVGRAIARDSAWAKNAIQAS